MKGRQICQFRIVGVPVPQPRVKATTRGKHAGVFTPTKTSKGNSNGILEYKHDVRKAAEAIGIALIANAVSVEMLFVFPRQSVKIWKSRPMPRYAKTTKPDLDNLAKSTMDCLNQVLWVDDAQVCDLSIQKMHASGDESPFSLITVWEWGIDENLQKKLF